MATVYDKFNADVNSVLNEVVPYLTSNWSWAAVENDNQYNGKIFYIDSAKTIGIHLYIRTGTNDIKVGVRFKGTDYHMSSEGASYSFRVEITNTTLILSYILGSTISTTNCEKIIVHNATNPNTNTTQQVISYIGSKSSSNVSAMYASDVSTPGDISEQNGNANVSSKYTALINLYNTKSSFVATDVYKSMFMELSAWSFGDVMLNGHRYRMSGPIFALDE